MVSLLVIQMCTQKNINFSFVRILAVSRLRAVGLQQGRDTAKGAMGVLVGQVKRLLNMPAEKDAGGGEEDNSCQ